MKRVSGVVPDAARVVVHAAAWALAAGLCGCAGLPSKTASSAPQRAGDVVQDEAYVEQVERTARRRGVGVTWINVPSRRLAASDIE